MQTLVAMSIKNALPYKVAANEVGARTLLAYRIGKKAFFMYGFAKNELDNIDSKELKALKQLAAIQLGWNEEQLALALQHGKLFEVTDHD
jgi:hypothetical protein